MSFVASTLLQAQCDACGALGDSVTQGGDLSEDEVRALVRSGFVSIRVKGKCNAIFCRSCLGRFADAKPGDGFAFGYDKD